MTELLNNRTDRSEQCKLLWYQWENDITSKASRFREVISSSSGLTESREYDISNHVMSFSYSKEKENGSGSFSFTLPNSKDWARFMKPGQWIVAALASDGTLPLPKEVGATPPNSGDITSGQFFNTLVANPPKGIEKTSALDLPEATIESSVLGPKIRCIGVIQRVSMTSDINEDGSLEVTYVVSGKDFGVCLEENELWFNFLAYEEIDYKNSFGLDPTTAGVDVVRNLKNVMELWTNGFISPDKVFKPRDSKGRNNIAKDKRQWLLPQNLMTRIGLPSLGEDSYFGNIPNLLEYHPTKFDYVVENPIAGLRGFAWERLKGLSQPAFHEFFTELTEEGKPRVFFRPIPWAIDTEEYPNIGQYMMTYLELVENRSRFQEHSFPNRLPKNPFKKPLEYRTNHSIDLFADSVLSFDIGPDFHSKRNHFLVDYSSSSSNQITFLNIQSKEADFEQGYPFRDLASIKRHGFRPMHIYNVETFLSETSDQTTDSPAAEFLRETNELITDLWGQAGDFFSGTLNVMGISEIKLGKVLVTDPNIQGIGSMALYIEGYSDNFTVDSDGNREWTQSITVTRGIELEDLRTRSGFKEKRPLDIVGTFIETPKSENNK